MIEKIWVGRGGNWEEGKGSLGELEYYAEQTGRKKATPSAIDRRVKPLHATAAGTLSYEREKRFIPETERERERRERNKDDT